MSLAVAGLISLGGSDGNFTDFAAAASPANAVKANPADAPQTANAEPTADAGAGDPQAPERRVLEVETGDTMITMLQDSGISAREAFKAVMALKNVYSPRDLRPGQRIHVGLERHDESKEAGVRLASLRLRASAEQDITLERGNEGDFSARAVERELVREVRGAKGEIESSLMAAANRENVPMKPLLKVIRGFSYAVDFQRDLRKGNDFEVVFERFNDSQGKLAKVGDLLYAALTVRGKRLEMYRFEREEGRAAYFNGKGESVRRLLMRTPINGARLSSGYGMRKHPILGYSRMHEGVDFAAPRGTPIYAAGNGRVEYAGWNGGYGRYVRIAHQGPYKTAYAHLKGFAKGVHGGARVSQGEVIGYLGNSGNSTGPHLHYEILKHGKAVNPRNLDLPTGYRLKGDELARFEAVKADIDAQRHRLSDTRMAAASCEGTAMAAQVPEAEAESAAEC